MTINLVQFSQYRLVNTRLPGITNFWLDFRYTFPIIVNKIQTSKVMKRKLTGNPDSKMVMLDSTV